MDDREKNAILRRIEAWRVASKVLDEERRARLRSMTDDECRRIIVDIFSLPLPRVASGSRDSSSSNGFSRNCDDPQGVIVAAREVQDRLSRAGFRFCFIGGISLPTCVAEDLVVMKVFADRGQDWVDVEAVVQ